MKSKELEFRMRQFALRIIRLAASLPKNLVAQTLGRQVLRSGTSIGANYCEAVYASSKKHFISLVEIAAREASETVYWLDLLAESEILPAKRLTELQKECHELLAILTASSRTAKRKN